MFNIEKEKIFYHCLNIACENNFVFLNNLKNHFHSFEIAWKSDNYQGVRDFDGGREETWEKFLKNKASLNQEKEWQKLKDDYIDLILLEEDSYPPLLKEIPSPPLGLYLKGALDIETSKIAIVGTRRCTDYGKRSTQKIAKELGQSGMIVVSGLADGIDTYSHEGALESGHQTIAVLGNGFDHIFPKSNTRLAEKITKQGCLISEYHPQTMADRHQFPARNRIVSGLSLGVVVIEAPEKSGALITANIALDQNREVFALPGSIFNTRSIGPNRLIQQGATPISSADDILEELYLPNRGGANPQKIDGLSKEEGLIIKILQGSENPQTPDNLISKSQLSPEKIATLLTMMELKGSLKEENGKYYFDS